MDRGLHNRGDMPKLLAAHGCEVIYAPLETPSAIGKVERAQGVMKAMLRKVVHDTECVGAKDFWNCSPRSPGGQNTMTRSNGYSPSQWVLGKNPRAPGSVTDLDEAGNLGVLEAAWDPLAKFYLNHQSRVAAQKAFVHLDTSSRITRALTRNAAVQGNLEYQVGDVVVYRRDTQQGGNGAQHAESLGSMLTKVFGFYMKVCQFCMLPTRSDQQTKLNLWPTPCCTTFQCCQR